MDEKQITRTTLLVDGSVLKKHMRKMGQEQNAQLIAQYLSHMVQTIRKEHPNGLVHIHYYGARLSDSVPKPISGEAHTEPEYKLALKHCHIPGALLKTSWGRAVCSAEQPWILKPECFNKDKLSDEDFVLNEHHKGVLSQLVDKLAVCAVRYSDTPVYVYGDSDDMAYALHTAKWLGADVHQMELMGKKPFISEVCDVKEPHFFNKSELQQIGILGKTQPDFDTFLKKWREHMPEHKEKSILMVDLGVLRKFLDINGCRTNVENVQKLLDQIQTVLPTKPVKTICYYSFGSASTKLVTPFPNPPKAFAEASEDRQILSLKGVEFSTGKTLQDKWDPYILKKEHWHKHPKDREYSDLIYNIRQHDTDCRVVTDMALARMCPDIDSLILVATDGDFAWQVEQANWAGLPTKLIHLDLGLKDLSFRLARGADEVIGVQLEKMGLTTRTQEEESKFQRLKANRVAKLKSWQKQRRKWAKTAYEDDEIKLSKSERWAEACGAKRQEQREHRPHRQ